eukprot:COSAG02_NODE_48554_length_333_cov_0.564103_2_plen_23_part_01
MCISLVTTLWMEIVSTLLLSLAF